MKDKNLIVNLLAAIFAAKWSERVSDLIKIKSYFNEVTLELLAAMQPNF